MGSMKNLPKFAQIPTKFAKFRQISFHKRVPTLQNLAKSCIEYLREMATNKSPQNVPFTAKALGAEGGGSYGLKADKELLCIYHVFSTG